MGYPTFIEGLRMLVLESIITSVTVNYFGGEPPDPQACSREPINKLECVAVDGMRGIFGVEWCSPAPSPPAAPRALLFDSDLAVWPASTCGSSCTQMQSLGAALAQPAVLPPRRRPFLWRRVCGRGTAPREPLMRRLDSSNRRGDDARLCQRGME